jgi:hypothetical protein
MTIVALSRPKKRHKPAATTNKLLPDRKRHTMKRNANNLRIERHLSTLPGLLGADQSDDPRQLGTLVELFPLDILVDTFDGRDVVADLEHPVLERQQLGQGVVQERCGEGDVGRRGAVVGDAHLELPRRLAGVLLLLGFGLGRARRRPVNKISKIPLRNLGYNILLALNKGVVLGHFGDAVRNTRRHDPVRRGMGAVCSSVRRVVGNGF